MSTVDWVLSSRSEMRLVKITTHVGTSLIYVLTSSKTLVLGKIMTHVGTSLIYVLTSCKTLVFLLSNRSFRHACSLHAMRSLEKCVRDRLHFNFCYDF